MEIITRIGKRRTLVIPKEIAEKVGIDEGVSIKIRIEDNKIIIEPIRDAIWLSLHGKKITKITLKDLEEESIKQQLKYRDK
ncbi:MAG: AbrB family transcriptional regulator [Thermoprotei archaeon ex4572_64]|nr:MAG: AbrB family transcriptional regulator [Thermoprotei archaeon ex4572_64]